MKRYHLEHDAQVAVLRWSQLAEHEFPELALLYAVANGGHRHITVAQKMKSEGVKAGVPDLCLPVARGGYHSLYIEMKQAGAKPKSDTAKGPLSDEQIRWIAALRNQGNKVAVCYGSAEAIEELKAYLKP